MDYRVRSTLNSIDNALVELLGEKAIAKITVKELCARAGINRATFYRHCRDVFSLMMDIEEALLAKLEEQLQLHLDDPLDIGDTMLFVSKCIKAEGERYRVLFSKNGDPVFSQKVFDVAYGHSKNDMQAAYPHLGEAQRQWIFGYVASGCCAIWQKWIADGMKQPPEEVAAFATALILEGANGFHPCSHIEDGFVDRARGVC